MSDPVFVLTSNAPFGLSGAGGSVSLDFVDIDNDGDMDAFTGNYDGNTLFFRNIGTASSPFFEAPRTNPFGLSDAGYSNRSNITNNSNAPSTPMSNEKITTTNE